MSFAYLLAFLAALQARAQLETPVVATGVGAVAVKPATTPKATKPATTPKPTKPAATPKPAKPAATPKPAKPTKPVLHTKPPGQAKPVETSSTSATTAASSTTVPERTTRVHTTHGTTALSTAETIPSSILPAARGVDAPADAAHGDTWPLPSGDLPPGVCPNLVQSNDHGTFGVSPLSRCLQHGSTQYGACSERVDPTMWCGLCQGHIAVGAANQFHMYATDMSGHTTGDDRDGYGMFNGCTNGEWALVEQMSVVPGQTLCASVYGRAWSGSNGMEIGIYDSAMNVIHLSDIVNVDTDRWLEIENEFNTGTNSTIFIGVRSTSNDASGNDFSLDDFSVRYIADCDPEPYFFPAGQNLVRSNANGTFGTGAAMRPLDAGTTEYGACQSGRQYYCHECEGGIVAGHIGQFHDHMPAEFSGHTTGDRGDGYAMFNGCANALALREPVAVVPFSRIAVELHAREWLGTTALQLVMTDSSGNLLAEGPAVTVTGNVWTRIAHTFDVGRHDNVVIGLRAASGVASGNDFAVDDFFITYVGEVPPAETVPMCPNLVQSNGAGSFGTISNLMEFDSATSELLQCHKDPPYSCDLCQGMVAFGPANNWHIYSSPMSGHTSGSANDGYAFINGCDSAVSALRERLTVVPGARMHVEYFARSWSGGDSPTALVRTEVKDNAGNLIYTSADRTPDFYRWVKMEDTFEVPRHVREIVVSIINANFDSGGNDYCLDDFFVGYDQNCQPTLRCNNVVTSHSNGTFGTGTAGSIAQINRNATFYNACAHVEPGIHCAACEAQIVFGLASQYHTFGNGIMAPSGQDNDGWAMFNGCGNATWALIERITSSNNQNIVVQFDMSAWAGPANIQIAMLNCAQEILESVDVGVADGGAWTRPSHTFNTGSYSDVFIAVRSTDTADNGNDFAIDNFQVFVPDGICVP